MNRSSLAALLPHGRIETESRAPVVVRSWRGEGSYARVYEAAWSGRPCALKVAKAEVPDAAARLRAEQGALRSLGHPHVVALLDSGEHAGSPFLILEWLDGETLEDLVRKRRRLPLRQALEHLEGACAGLAHIHERGRAHGDLRAENIIVVPGRGAVLTDPGAGTSPAEDVRALGALFHCMLTGEDPAPTPRLVPGAGYNRAAVELWQRTRAEAPPAAPELLAEVRRLRGSL